jgi:hypothetical protein
MSNQLKLAGRKTNVQLNRLFLIDILYSVFHIAWISWLYERHNIHIEEKDKNEKGKRISMV